MPNVSASLSDEEYEWFESAKTQLNMSTTAFLKHCLTFFRDHSNSPSSELSNSTEDINRINEKCTMILQAISEFRTMSDSADRKIYDEAYISRDLITHLFLNRFVRKDALVHVNKLHAACDMPPLEK